MMNRLTKATYVYWLLVMINFVSVMFNVSLYLLITSYISKKNLSLYLLQQLQVIPGNFRLLFLGSICTFWMLSYCHLFTPNLNQ